MKSIISALFAVSTLFMALDSVAKTLWQENANPSKADATGLNAKADNARYINFQHQALQKQFQSGGSTISIRIPAPDGTSIPIKLLEDSVMEPELANKFPNIKSYKAVDKDGLQIGRFSYSHKGLHGMYLHSGEWAYLDPRFTHQTTEYISYFRKDARRTRQRSFNENLSQILENRTRQTKIEFNAATADTGDVVTTYRLAVATAGEYTQFHGGNIEDGIAALNVMLNRVNQIYLVDVAVQFVLVANNDQIVFTDPDNDPFNNDVDDIDLVQAVVDEAIGVANYDIGHIFNTSDYALARLGSVCGVQKARGLTGLSEPATDIFHVDFVAHEFGHQFQANHTFNANTGSCEGNRWFASAWEPGSGSTIMGYAGLCGDLDLQESADDFFHIGSVEQMRNFIENGMGSTCGTQSVISNTAPSVTAGNDYIIPANTPFMLSGEGSDADNDSLVYNWEQIDVGAISSSEAQMVDDGTRPLFRSRPGTPEPVRYFPDFSDVLSGITTLGETYSTSSRTMDFRLTARDRRGGLSTDAIQLTTVANDIGFSLREPSSTMSWNAGGYGILVWNPAGSAWSPVNCETLDLQISNDSGSSFDDYDNNIGNDGVTVLTVPTLEGNNYRLKLNCSDNVFFAVHQTDFSVIPAIDSTDSDGDGLPDDWETENGLDPNEASDAAVDSDEDGLSNLEEYLLELDPNSVDSDGNGIDDLDDTTGNSASGTVSQPPLDPSVFVEYDYDGDGKADIGVRRPSNFFQYISNSSDEQTQRVLFGKNISDIPLSGDFDGDNIADVAVRRPADFFFYISNSSDGELQRIQFGRNSADIPVPADYDGDGITDVAVRRPSNQTWYIRNSSGVDPIDGNDDGISRVRFGTQEGDIPVVADFDGDGKADIAVRRSSNFFWYIRNSSGTDPISDNADGITRQRFGLNTDDIPVPADYDGDGKADLAVRRPSNFTWYIRNSSGEDPINGALDGLSRVVFGRNAEDIPIPADYDGDGKTDLAVRRASNQFQYVLRSSDEEITRLQFGRQSTDIPLAAPILTRMAMVQDASN